jgi:hypothetical protein
MSRLPVTPGDLARHRRRLVLLTGATALCFPLLAAAGFLLPRVPLPGIRPAWVTAAALVAGLFLSLRVEKVAQRLVFRVKEAYAAGGNTAGLLRGHVHAYLVILAWLLGIGLAGLAVALAGAGPRAALWFHGAGFLLTLLAWPTERKVRLLLRRAQDLRDREDSAPAGTTPQDSGD